MLPDPKILFLHDISIKLRLKSQLNRKTLISVQGYRICKKSVYFLKRWIKYVEDIPPHKRRMGYGQTSCYYAYKDVKNDVKWGSVESRFCSPRMLETDVIWSGNTTKGKVRNLQLCRKDFNKMRGK